MQKSHESQSAGTVNRFPLQPMQKIEPYFLSRFRISNNNMSSDNGSIQEAPVSSHYSELFYTLDSCPVDYVGCSSPSNISISSNQSPVSAQCSHSCLSNRDNTYGSPVSGSPMANNGNELKHIPTELENKLLAQEAETDDSCSYMFNSVVPKASSSIKYDQLLQRIRSLDLKQLLLACAEAVSEGDLSTVNTLLEVLESMVSVTGEPIQRLGAYMLEGIRARLLSSGATIYQKLKCDQPTSAELMSYMGVMYQVVPIYKFAYTSSNVIIAEAMENEAKIHIIDFQIALGSQWVALIQTLAQRAGGPPYVRVTGVDDSNSAYARGGGLHLVGQRLSAVAKSCGVLFEFHGAAISGSEVTLENLGVKEGEALAVTFPYVLHHIPDESVSTTNHRDRLLRLIKSLSPKVVTLLEQESNTNTSAFFPRFRETLEYYTAMFEAIDAARPRDDKLRISAEEHCVARDIVNMIACEEAERVERHELLGKWRLRLSMAGLSQCTLSYAVGDAMKDVLKEYSNNFRLEYKNGALYLCWKNRDLVTCSAWR